jgi:hypothetical protein
MTFKYRLSDAWKLDNFHKLTKKAFTFDNGQQGSSSALSRIDKFLVSQSMEERRENRGFHLGAEAHGPLATHNLDLGDPSD